MSRPVDPNAQYQVKPHTTKGYTYASTQPCITDPGSGRKKYRYIHWGTIDEDLRFIPSSPYILASPEERRRLIFPKDWDMSVAEGLTGLRKPRKPPYDGECQNRLYGDVWLLEQISLCTGIRQDLEAVFDGNREIVDDILTLAMFPYITKYTYSRVARWQRAVKSPSARELTPKAITLLTQSITEQNRMDLLKRRAARLAKDELCAVDSTSRSAYGGSLADIHWGKNKEGLPLEQTTEVVVYTLSSHMPVYYRTFPGNKPDSRSLGTILLDLDHAGFKEIVLVTDRGYDSLQNLEKYILSGQAMVMCVKTGQRDAAKTISGLGEFGARPDGMAVDADARIYYKQYDFAYAFENDRQTSTVSNLLKLNLYFDPVRRGLELMELDIALTAQGAALSEAVKNKEPLSDDAAIKREYCYYKVVYDPATRIVKSFEANEKKIAKARSFSGFFTIMTHGVYFDAMETYRVYCLRDEQEKYFQQMKDQMVADRQRNWSEEGKTVRLFILFVSLILSSYVRHVWKSTKYLKDKFPSSLDILDEMRPIRMIEHTNRAKAITPFVGAQIDICDAFGFKIPDGCAPKYKSRQKPTRRRSSTAKKSSEKD